MNPTLRPGDRLRVLPYDEKRICMGDVVVFQSPETKHVVVHRVVAVDPNGVKTRGDNNACTDPWLLRPEDIIGRIVSLNRKNRNVKMHGGIRGRISTLSLQLLTRIDLSVSKILRPVYHKLSESGIFRKCLRILPDARILSFTRHKGQELQLLIGSRVIGRRLPGNDGWQIRRPFRLFVDEADLPR